MDARFFSLLPASWPAPARSTAPRAPPACYKGAWLALEATGNVAHPPLLSTTVQGSQQTAAAVALLEAWQRLQAAHRDFLRLQEDWLVQEIGHENHGAQPVRRHHHRAAARPGPADTEATLALRGGNPIVAMVASNAAQRMKLNPGDEAVALVKSSAVMFALPSS